MTIDEVIDVISVRNGVMTAAWSVLVIGRVAGALVTRRTRLGVRPIDGNLALVDVIAVDEVQMAIVQVVDVASVFDRAMAAVRTVNVVVIVVLVVIAHAAPCRCRPIGDHLLHDGVDGGVNRATSYSSSSSSTSALIASSSRSSSSSGGGGGAACGF